MDRIKIYAGQIPLETDLLQSNRFAMVGLAKLAAAILGTSTLVNGLACAPTSPASLQVQVAAGEIYSLQNLDGTPYSTLPADTTHQIVKQGIRLDAGNLSCPAPGTAGFSINYLVQVTYLDQDTNNVVLPYYNASNPSQAYSGPNNDGTAQATVRAGVANVTVKAGVAATTGTQTTPAPDAGYTGLWVVTVANGQTTITSGNIAQASGAPFLAETLIQKISQATADARYLQISQATGRLLRTTVYARVGGVQQVSVNGGAFTSTGASTHTRHADAQTIIGEVQAAGGAGAGAGSAGAGNVSMGAPGGSGSYGKSIWTAAAFGASQAITVGAGGVAASNAAGGNGGSSSIGSLLTTPGGIGGGLSNNVPPPSQNGNGSFTTAPTGANMVSVRGGSTQATFGLAASTGIGGTGGNSMFGVGATGPGINTNGITALNYGTGGSGCVVNNAGGTAIGGDGADGIVIIQEFA